MVISVLLCDAPFPAVLALSPENSRACNLGKQICAGFLKPIFCYRIYTIQSKVIGGTQTPFEIVPRAPVIEALHLNTPLHTPMND